MIKCISEKTAKFLKKYDESIDEEKEEILVYGLEVLLYEISMIFVVFVISFIFGIELYIFCAVASYSFIRLFASGVHAKTRVVCASTYLFCIYFSVLFPIYVFNQYIANVAILLYSLNMIFLLKYAPGDTVENPMTDDKKIKFKRLASIVTVNIIFLIAFFAKEQPILSNIIMLSSTVAAFFTTPLLYKIFGCERSEYTKV